MASPRSAPSPSKRPRKKTAKATAKKPGERRGRKKGAARPSSDQILEAAERVFAKQGFADTSLRQLMSAAGVSTTAFYARFPSRDAVLEAIATRFLEQLAVAAAERLPGVKNIGEGFDAGVDVLVATMQGRRPLVRLLLGEASGSDIVRGALGGAFEQLAQLLAGQLQRLVDKGHIEASDAEATGWALVGAMKIQVERWALYDAIDDDELGPALRATARAMLPVIKRRAR
jgi:AcrR family transcriptional regulator